MQFLNFANSVVLLSINLNQTDLLQAILSSFCWGQRKLSEIQLFICFMKEPTNVLSTSTYILVQVNFLPTSVVSNKFMGITTLFWCSEQPQALLLIL